MTPEDIAKARKIINKANRGPWEHDLDIGGIWYVSIKDEHLITAEQCGQEDAAFIAAARTGWPEALDEIERLNRVAISQESLLKTLGEMKNENEKLQAVVDAAKQLDAKYMGNVVYLDRSDMTDLQFALEALEKE